MSTQQTSQTASSTKQFATFYVGEFLFGIDVQKVQEIIKCQDITPVPLSSQIVEGLINLRGQIITAVDLRRRLGIEIKNPDIKPMNVVVHTSDGVVSLLVDKVGDVVDAQSDSFESTPNTVKGVVRDLVHGVYKLKDSLLLILDAEGASSINLN